MKNGVIMGRLGKWTGMVSILFFAATAVSCGNEVNPAGFICEDASFIFSRCPSVRSCCSDTFCYYDVDGLTFDCQGTDCSRASDRVVDHCTATTEDATTSDDDHQEVSGPDAGSTDSCDPCRYCAQVISFTSDGQGFASAEEVICGIAECDDDGNPDCIVNEPMYFVGQTSDCTEFSDTCPGDTSLECSGKAGVCSIYLVQSGWSGWDCNQSQYCNHYTGEWNCPTGYTYGDKCGN